MVQKISQLKKREFTDESLVIEEVKPKPKTHLYVYPLLVKQLHELGIQYERDLADVSLDRFFSSMVNDEYEKHVSVIVRLRSVDRLAKQKSRQKKEYIIWYTQYFARDANGNKIPSVDSLPHGLDKQVLWSTSTDVQGVKHNKVEDTYNVYTEEFSPQKVDQALAENPDTDLSRVHYIVIGSRRWGGFTLEEIKNLTFEDLEERGRTGQAGRATDPEILEKENALRNLREKKEKEKESNITANRKQNTKQSKTKGSKE